MSKLRDAALNAYLALSKSTPNKREGDDDYCELGLKEHAYAVNALREALDEPEPTCTWADQDDICLPGTYETECGELWSFTDGGVADNNARFCHGCGGKIEVKK